MLTFYILFCLNCEDGFVWLKFSYANTQNTLQEKMPITMGKIVAMTTKLLQ